MALMAMAKGPGSMPNPFKQRLTPQASADPRHAGRHPRPFHPPKPPKPQAIVSVEEKAVIIEAAKIAILEGGQPLKQIAEQHRISRRTLQFWLAGLGEEYETLRCAWIDMLLVEAGEELEQVGGFDQLHASKIKLTRDQVNVEQLRLARAREIWKRATWYAERRDAARYGPKGEVTMNDKKVIVHIHREAAKPVPIDRQPVDVTAQLIQTVMETGTAWESAPVEPL